MRTLAVVTLVTCSTVPFFICVGCGDSPPPVAESPAVPTPPPPPEPKPQPKPKPIQLAALDDVSLRPGERASVKLHVERNGNKGPVRVEVGNVPEGVTVTAPEILADQSTGQLLVAAGVSLGESDLMSLMPVTVTTGELKAERALRLSVAKINLPSFQPAAGVILQPGTSQSVTLTIHRNGHQGPLPLRVENAPAKVQCNVDPIPAEGNSVRLQVVAAADAADASQKLRVTATLFGREIAIELPVKIERQPYRVDTFQVVTLEPGETRSVEVPIKRGSYQGSIQLGVQGLPDGVVVENTVVAEGQDVADLEFRAVEDAVQRVRSASVVAKAGHLTGSGPIVIRVSRGDDTYLPAAIAANSEIAPLLRRGSMGGRLTTDSKEALLDFYGGTPESEAAVLRGLQWLASHQQPDGSWPLDEYSRGITGCDCKTEFEKKLDESDTAGTAFGVLAFLGAGVTHNRAPEDPPILAEYKEVVEKGLVFLGRNQVTSGDKNVGHMGGSMYAHTLGTIAFCEAYGLSGDERTKINAQLAIKYLLDAQHKEGGGWRYGKGQAGDMSVTGWVILAIRSAQLAGLPIERGPLIRAERFVNSCAVGPDEAKRSRYAYQPGQAEKLALSAAGLLTRQYLGWRKEEPDLLAGCEYLLQHMPPDSGTSLGTIYYYYYATQVLHHMEGPNFDMWNHRLREHLIRTQEKSGHRAGSWSPQGTDHGARGGRMYATGMALLTLQTYYRHLPMYRPVKYTGR